VRILVYPHSLAIGGSQINAIDLAAGVAAAGHEVIVYGIAGPLEDYIRQRGLRFEPARRLRYRPAPSRIAQIAAIARRERIDLIHAYEWPPCLDSYFGAGLALGIPVLCTVLGMVVMPYVPASVPLIMGTAALGDEARAVQESDVWVLEPPIDTVNDQPGVDGAPFRRAHDVGDSDLLVSTVSRLALDLKLDALVRAIDAADMLAGRFPLKLVVVGGGEAQQALQRRADYVNQRWNRPVVVLAGPLLDPRSAYAASDVVVGMGSSAMRAMAIGKPVVVQGEQAFSQLFEPRTADYFLRHGFYGLGDGEPGSARLSAQLEALLVSRDLRLRLGEFGRRTIVERFSLGRAVKLQLDIYASVIASPGRRRPTHALRSAVRALALEISNHSPLVKKVDRRRQRDLLLRAGEGPWPRPNRG
jgi:glycosyltransferase involved in cell wall biosynthesis